MAEETKQTATETTDATATQVAEGASAPEDKDPVQEAFAEYDAANERTDDKGSKPGQTGDGKDQIDVAVLAAEVNSLKAERLKASDDAAIDGMVASLKASAPDYPDGIIRGWIYAQAAAEPKINDVFNGREKNPKAFQTMVKGLGQRLAKEAKQQPDANATADHDAVANAVRRNGNKAPEGKAPKYGEMSNQEFAKDTKERYGFTPPV